MAATSGSGPNLEHSEARATGGSRWFDGRVGLVSIVGGESTGKSTLALALAEELPALLVPETLREWVETHGRVPRPDEQRAVMLAHAEAEAQLLAQAQAHAEESAGVFESRSVGPPGSAGPAWVISDSGPLMTAVYSILYYGDQSLVADAVALAGRSELVVWCADDIPWVADADQRDGPHVRSAAQDVLGDLLATAELPYLRVTGPLSDRVAQVRRQLDREAGSPR